MRNLVLFFERQVPLSYGAAVVASTAVGVGMMSLPIVSLGMWFFLSLFVLLTTAIYVIAAGSLLLEVNMRYPIGTGIHTMVHDLLGTRHALLCDFTMIFNGFILLYAYITVGTEAVQFYANQLASFELNRYSAGILFAGVFGAIFYSAPLMISRFLGLFVFVMALSFIYIVYHLSSTVEIEYITLPSVENSYSLKLLPFTLVALPFFMAAMGFQQVIPMLRELYSNKPKRVMKSIILGIVFVSCIYGIWLFVIMANQPREEMILSVTSGKDNIETVVKTISQNESVKSLMFFFVQIAVLTSFIGVAKGLLDYLTDFASNRYGFSPRYSKLLVLIVPLLLSLAFPYGFLVAIGFAGLAGAVWSGVYPALMALVVRERSSETLPKQSYRAFGGRVTPWFTFGYSTVLIVVMLLGYFELLPKLS